MDLLPFIKKIKFTACVMLGAHYSAPSIDSSLMEKLAGIAQLVEHFTCNEDVTGSTPVAGSSWKCMRSMLRLLRIFLLSLCVSMGLVKK